MKTKILLFIAIAVTLIGCTRDNFLDFQPKQVIVPSKVSDYRLLLDQISTPSTDELFVGEGFINSAVGAYYVSDHIELTLDAYLIMGVNRNVLDRYTLQEKFHLGIEEDSEWNTYYNQIYTANIVLNGLDTASGGSEQEKNGLRAEARLHRAFAYFNLVNLYSIHYNPATANTDLGVPIREGIELTDLDLTRASVQKVYDYIIQDITTSYSSLPDVNPMNVRFRPSKAGAAGLLAKVYLYQNEYGLALEEVNKALELYSTVRHIEDNIEDDALVFPLAQDDTQVIWYKEGVSNLKTFIPLVIVENDFIDNLYEADDLRLKGFKLLEETFFGDEAEQGTTHSYHDETSSDNSAGIPVGINTPELLLIKAECEVRSDKLLEANSTLNSLRENRYEIGSYTDINITDKTDLLNFVKDERERELISKPYCLFDIKRYNRFDNANITLTHEFDGNTYTIQPNSLNWAFPIAEKYILQNPEIKQNPRD